jgi:hypothetical protein
MRALTLNQWPLPYASLVAEELKGYETRSAKYWTEYRGDVVIHAAKSRRRTSLTQLTKFVRHHSSEWVKIHVLGCQNLLGTLPYGSILCIATITDCIVMTREFIESQSALELAVGHWEVGRVALKLENIRKLPAPLLIERGWQSWGRTSNEMDTQIRALIN